MCMPPGGTLISSPWSCTRRSRSGRKISPKTLASAEKDATFTSGGTSVRCLWRRTSPVPVSLGGSTDTDSVATSTWLSNRSPTASSRRCLTAGASAIGSDRMTMRIAPATSAACVTRRRLKGTPPSHATSLPWLGGPQPAHLGTWSPTVSVRRYIAASRSGRAGLRRHERPTSAVLQREGPASAGPRRAGSSPPLPQKFSQNVAAAAWTTASRIRSSRRLPPAGVLISNQAYSGNCAVIKSRPAVSRSPLMLTAVPYGKNRVIGVMQRHAPPAIPPITNSTIVRPNPIAMAARLRRMPYDVCAAVSARASSSARSRAFRVSEAARSNSVRASA
nr:unknown [uncultured bacterium]